MKILVIGGMHGNEPLGIAIVKLFKQQPVIGVDVVLANGPAVNKVTRFVGSDLNRSFPGDIKSTQYEEKRAAQLLMLAAQYDLVLDFHNTHCPENDCGFVGETAPQEINNISAWLGLKRIIVADYECINKYAPNCLSVEVSLSSQKMNAKLWYERISRLAQLNGVQESTEVERYRFVYRMTLEDKVRLKLPSRSLKAFDEIPKDICDALQLSNPAYPIFIDDAYTPYNYGGVLNRR